MPKEYRRFGDKIVQREEGSTDDWEEVPADDADQALKAIEQAEAEWAANAARGAQGKIEIRRVSQGEPPFET